MFLIFWIKFLKKILKEPNEVWLTGGVFGKFCLHKAI